MKKIKKTKKKKTNEVECLICKKKIKIPDEFRGWEDGYDKKFEKNVKEIDEKVTDIIEFLNHDKDIDTMSKRVSILSWVVKKLMSNTFTNNYFRIGLLEHLVFELNVQSLQITQGKVLEQALDIVKEEQKKTVNNKKNKYVM